jgi:thioredoxin reductase (NADPH)
LQTNVAGVFACGDCRANQLKQVAVAVGEGALAAVEADRYIEENF